MLYWTSYGGHRVKSRRKYDETIYTFDIETTSYLILGDTIIPASDYLTLTEEEKEASNPQACMYIWQFSVNETVYYGRTWDEFKEFLAKLEQNSPKKKIIFVHNLSFEFQFICQVLNIESVLSRKSRKVMTARLADMNFEFRCSYYMSNVKLSKLAEIYNLPVKKKVGDLDYTKIRTPATELTEAELGYCEADCQIVYEYIKLELETYKHVDRIPITSTGQVRRELQRLVLKDNTYKQIVNRCIDIKPSVFNRLTEAFAGGYTHANYMYTDEVLPNVDSFDETSAYPYVMVAYKFPMKSFKECTVKKAEDLSDRFAYLLRVKFHRLRSKYYNNFISMSKCLNIRRGVYDNGRIIAAEEVEITITDVDFKFILDTYDIESYEIIESYYSIYKYLPKQFIKFILQKYINKTQYKGVPDKALAYQKEKAKFNSLYGMTVTNMIRDDVSYSSRLGWRESPITDSQIFDKLCSEKKKSFLSFAWGVWVTAYARNNLLRRVVDLDPYVVYCDTDSIKLVQGYDKSVIDKYNETVLERIRNVSELLEIPLDEFQPEDVKGKKHPLGVFDYEGRYDKFITQGAKKYCVEKDGEIEITVSGVPKSGAKCLTRIDDFRDNLVFDHKFTNKSTLMYNDNQLPLDIVDYNGVQYKVVDKTGVALIPTTYELGKAIEYASLLSDNSTARAKFKHE